MINSSFIMLGFGIIFILILIIAVYIITKTFTAPTKETYAKVRSKRRTRNARGRTSYKVLFENNGELIECIVRYDIFNLLNEGDEGLLKYQDGIFKLFIDFTKNS